MNTERIKELSLKARENVANIRTLPDGQREMTWVQEAYDEEFAKLIVRECIRVGGPEDSYKDDWFNAKVDSVAKIKKHFGVE